MKALNSAVVLTLIVCFLSPNVSVAQDTNKTTDTESVRQKKTQRTRGPEPRDIRVFYLKHMNAWEACDLLRTTIGVLASADERTNSLVARASKQVLEQIESMLQQLDVPDSKGVSSIGTIVYQVKHRGPEVLADMLDETFRRVRVVVDEDSGMLLIRGAKSEQEEVTKLLTQLDIPAKEIPEPAAKTLAITIDFIQATAGSKELGELPDNLEEVGEALLYTGVGDFGLYGHFMARAREGEKFESSGVVKADTESLPASFVHVKGEAALAAGGNAAEIEVRVVINAPLPHVAISQEEILSGKGKKYSYEDFGISTSSTVPLDDYLILGAMPASIEQSDTILLVIRVTED